MELNADQILYVLVKQLLKIDYLEGELAKKKEGESEMKDANQHN